MPESARLLEAIIEINAPIEKASSQLDSMLGKTKSYASETNVVVDKMFREWKDSTQKFTDDVSKMQGKINWEVGMLRMKDTWTRGLKAWEQQVAASSQRVADSTIQAAQRVMARQNESIGRWQLSRDITSIGVGNDAGYNADLNAAISYGNDATRMRNASDPTGANQYRSMMLRTGRIMAGSAAAGIVGAAAGDEAGSVVSAGAQGGIIGGMAGGPTGAALGVVMGSTAEAIRQFASAISSASGSVRSFIDSLDRPGVSDDIVARGIAGEQSVMGLLKSDEQVPAPSWIDMFNPWFNENDKAKLEQVDKLAQFRLRAIIGGREAEAKRARDSMHMSAFEDSLEAQLFAKEKADDEMRFQKELREEGKRVEQFGFNDVNDAARLGLDSGNWQDDVRREMRFRGLTPTASERFGAEGLSSAVQQAALTKDEAKEQRERQIQATLKIDENTRQIPPLLERLLDKPAVFADGGLA